MSLTFIGNAQPITGESIQVSDSCGIHLSKAIQFKTISYDDEGKVDHLEFLQFCNFLEKTFPLVHRHLQRIIVSDYNSIYKWVGADTSLPPYLLMAHEDVVPAENDGVASWSVNPFAGVIKNDTIWGRGAVDDKGTLIAILEAAEILLAKNFQPRRSIYFCFGHDEEVGGRNGALAITRWFDQQHIHPELVLDEGMEVISRKFPQLKQPLALIGIGEKGYASFHLTVEKPGGHSSAPEKETAISILSQALVKLQNNPSPAKLIPPVKYFLKRLKPYLPSYMRFAIGNLWLFKKTLLKKMSGNIGMNAVIRTTLVTTVISGGIKENVIPSVAKATINCRILPGETVDETEKFIRRQINDERVIITRGIFFSEASTFTPVEGKAYKTIESLVTKFFPGAVPAPMLVISASDSRYLRSISTGVINFTPSIDSEGLHGINEYRSIPDLKRMIRFYAALLAE
jgi:carboxypeptidase PM20D1